MTLHVHIISQSQNDILDLNSQFPRGGKDQGLGLTDGGVDGLEDGDGEGGGFTGTGLGLSDDVSAGGDGLDGSLLDGGGFLEVCRYEESDVDQHRPFGDDPHLSNSEVLLTVSVDSSEKILLQSHRLDYSPSSQGQDSGQGRESHSVNRQRDEMGRS